MSDTHVRGEMHGCVVCGRLYELYVVYDKNENFVDCKVMSPDAKRVPDSRRPLVACNRHSGQQIDTALTRTHGMQATDE